MVFRRVLWNRGVLFSSCHYLIRSLPKPGAGYLLVGNLLYLVGTILVTIVCNVPLNDTLAGVNPASAYSAPTWTNYLKTWTTWNHVRTVAALATAALFTVALCRASSSPDFARSKMSSPITTAALPSQPGDWPRQFEKQLNAGDLDGVMALYEKDARFVTRTGETLVGRDAIRKELGGLMEAKTQFHSRVVRATIIGEMAQLHTDFEGTTKMTPGILFPFVPKVSKSCVVSPMGVGSQSWVIPMDANEILPLISREA